LSQGSLCRKPYPLPTSSHFEKGGKGDLIKGDTEKSTPALLYKRREMKEQSGF